MTPKAKGQQQHPKMCGHKSFARAPITEIQHFPSRHTNLEREAAFETPEQRPQRNLQARPIFDVAQVPQEEKKKQVAQPKEHFRP